ncbi:hypothetical protein [Microvirga antarctica]|uniref:hypothetical protein n=1 Tax=Microvirga antarctica TaxID=2819233 RepID=UPI001B311588|nr:hypothetical protein [Microvirga antarctica]
MSWICEIAVTGSTDLRSGLRDWQANNERRFAELPGLSAADFYIPTEQASQDPFNHEVAGPLLIVMLEFASETALRAALAEATIASGLATLPPGLAATASVFERAFYPVADDETAAPLKAPVSYVVRYHLPADDEAAFIRNYVDSHPPTQAKLPGIRAIMCYFPRPDITVLGVAAVDYLVGNEVVFDTVQDFNAAMKSPVRHELRAHFKEFPPFSGANTHFLMHRRRLLPLTPAI